VLGLLCPHLVAYFFDAQGNLLGDEHRPWASPAPRPDPDGPFDIYDETFRAALAQQQKAWMKELGFRKRAIKVREFFDPRHPVGIQRVPDHFKLDAGEGLDPEQRAGWEESRAAWLEGGSYVWWWADEYEVDEDGEVEST